MPVCDKIAPTVATPPSPPADDPAPATVVTEPPLVAPALATVVTEPPLVAPALPPPDVLLSLPQLAPANSATAATNPIDPRLMLPPCAGPTVR